MCEKVWNSKLKVEKGDKMKYDFRLKKLNKI